MIRSRDLTAVVVGGRSVPLLDVIDSWAAQVLRMYRESIDPPQPGEDEWGADDLIGALHARQRIENALRGVEAPADDLLALAVADQLFRIFTDVDKDGLLAESGMPIPEGPWYWKRVPRSGPVWRDLNEWRTARLSGGG